MCVYVRARWLVGKEGKVEETVSVRGRPAGRLTARRVVVSFVLNESAAGGGAGNVLKNRVQGGNGARRARRLSFVELCVVLLELTQCDEEVDLSCGFVVFSVPGREPWVVEGQAAHN